MVAFLVCVEIFQMELGRDAGWLSCIVIQMQLQQIIKKEQRF